MDTTDKTYEGWANRATWNVYLWLNNDEPSYRHLQEFLKSNKTRITPKIACGYCTDIFRSMTPDRCKLSEVVWVEIAAAMETDRLEALRYA